MTKAKFKLGQIYMTREINDRVADDEEFARFVIDSLKRDTRGDWGSLYEEDRQENELSLKEGFRLFSAYKYKEEKTWIITEADRSATTDEVKSKVSIKDILAHYGLLAGLNEKGDELVGLCPFHEETKGSFRANLVKNAFHCFVCKAKGNILDFVSLKEGVSIREAALLIQDWFEIRPESSQEAPGKDKWPKTVESSPLKSKRVKMRRIQSMTWSILL